MIRRCQVCGANLNSYNSGKLCFPCQKTIREEVIERMAWPARLLPGTRGPLTTARIFYQRNRLKEKNLLC